MEYAKFWVGLVGAVLAAVIATWPEAPQWLFVVAASVTAVGVYLTPNREAYEPQHDAEDVA